MRTRLNEPMAAPIKGKQPEAICQIPTIMEQIEAAVKDPQTMFNGQQHLTPPRWFTDSGMIHWAA